MRISFVTRSRLPALIIGAGLMGRHHAKAAVLSGAFVACIVDSDLNAAKQLAAKHRRASVSTDLHEALSTSEAIVAHVCTPAGSHQAIAVALANAGMHALVEKPLGTTAAVARYIHDSFGYVHGGKLVCPTHQYAFQRSVMRIAAMLPELGLIRRISFEVCSAGAVSGNMTGDDLVAEILPHLLAILQRLQPLIKLQALEWTLIRSAEGEWSVSACADGTLVTMALSAGGRPTRFRTFITGGHASVEIDHFHDFAIFLPGQVSKAQKITGPFSRSTCEFLTAGSNLVARAVRGEFAYPGLRRLVSEFYDAIRDGSQCPIMPEQSIDVAVARDAILALADNG